MSLADYGDLNQQLRSARAWMKDRAAAAPAAAEPDSGPLPRKPEVAQTDEPKPVPSKNRTTAQDPKVVPLSARASASGQMAVGQYDRMIEDMLRDESRAGVTQHVIKVEQAEVAALVWQVTRAKGRYLAMLLESSKRKHMSSTTIEDLRLLRESHEELQRGLSELRRHIRDGIVIVEGVEN